MLLTSSDARIEIRLNTFEDSLSSEASTGRLPDGLFSVRYDQYEDFYYTACTGHVQGSETQTISLLEKYAVLIGLSRWSAWP